MGAFSLTLNIKQDRYAYNKHLQLFMIVWCKQLPENKLHLGYALIDIVLVKKNKMNTHR